MNETDFLKNFETKYRGFTRVPNVNYHSRNNKFFYGAVLTINDIDYFVPVSSNTRVKQDDILIVVIPLYRRDYGSLYALEQSALGDVLLFAQQSDCLKKFAVIHFSDRSFR